MRGDGKKSWMQRWASALLLCCLGSMAGHAAEVPAELGPWTEWVAHEVPEASCPLLPNTEERLCFWPGEFEFEVSASQAQFNGAVSTSGETLVPLPGSSKVWPQQVQVDGREVAVVANGEQPMLRLKRGDYRISGVIDFERRPEELPLPAAYALIKLTLDGRLVEQIRRTPGGLWLGRPEDSSTPKADSLQLEVYRLLADGMPPQLVTQLKVNVAGRAREQRLGPVLPPGFALIRIDSPLNVRQDGNELIVQLRPGSFEITLTARSLAPLNELALSRGAEPWPVTEIWSYSPNPVVRESNAAGPAAIDPAQAGVPEGWRAFASFLMDGSSPLKIEVGGRGLTSDEPNRLHLRRQLWLSFDASRWLAKDAISGEMRSDWRLDATPPFALTRAEVNGEPVLVTRSGEATGIEIRQPAPNIQASAEAPFSRKFPALGWQQDFESAQIALQLPPGWRLLDVSGADRVDSAWFSRFQLSTVLLLAVLAVLAWRFVGVKYALLAVLLAVLGLGEFGEAASLLLVLLGFGLLARLLPQGRIKRLGSLASWAALLLSVLACLPFIERQLALALYPQLERTDLSGGYASGNASALDLLGGVLPSGAGRSDDGLVYQANEAASPPPPAPAAMAAPVADMAMRAAAEPQAQSNMVMSKGDSNAFDQRRSRKLERYSAGTNVQAGNAEPDWRWNGHAIYFDGRVTSATELQPWLLPPWVMSAWRLASVLALLLLLWGFARQLRQVGSLPTGRRWLFTATALLLVGTPVLAAELPDQEWLDRIRARLLEAPPCQANGCASVARAEVIANDSGIVIVLQAHAEAATVLALPELAGHSWNSASIDGAPAALNRYNERLWVALPEGVHRLQLEARLDRSDTVRLSFPTVPMRVLCKAEGWLCTGTNEGRLLSDTLEFTPEASDQPDSSGAVPTARSSIAPFVQVVRDFNFELDWVIETTVQRVAPAEGGITVRIPLLEGEQLLSEGLEVRDGAVSVSIQPGASSVSFTTQIDPVAGLELIAAPWASYSETWRLHPGPAWHLSFSGVPPVQPQYNEEEWVHWFYPLPGEKLQIELDRPEAAAGSTLAIDNVNLLTHAGNRQQDSTLNLALRATQGGQHTLKLPADAELTAVRMDGTTLNSKLREGVLSLPIRPGSQQLTVEFRQDLPAGLSQGVPEVDLRAPVSNIHLTYTPAPNRWLLWTSGPTIGPALQTWPTLLVLLVLVIGLGRWQLLPVPLIQGLLLAVGATLLFWPLLLPWLLLIGLYRWREQHGGRLRTWSFRSLQLVVLGLTALVLLLSLTAIGARLNDGPDMGVSGLGSSSYQLNWFTDLSADGKLPAASVLSLPRWVFQTVLLLWTAWFGWRMFGWLRDGWRAFRKDGWLTPACAQTAVLDDAGLVEPGDAIAPEAAGSGQGRI